MSLALFALTFVSIGLASPLVATAVETTADLTQIPDTPAATLLKRHDYAMWCPGDGLQAYCQGIGYYCSGTGKLTHRNRRDSRCARGCSCVNLGPAPVPCINEILGFCADVVDEAAAGGSGIVVTPSKTLATVTATATSTATSAATSTAPVTLEKRHDYAMWCPGNGLQTYCYNIGYYCSASGKLTHGSGRDSQCARGCSCINLNPAPKPCINEILGFCADLDEAEAGGNGTVVNPTKPLATATATAETGGNGTVVSPTKTLATATATLEKRQLATATEDLDKRHSWAMDCGMLNSYCNQKGYYCDSQGLLAYQFDEWSTCNTCKCVNTNPVPRPLISVKPCINVILGFCQDVDETEAGVDTVESGEAV
jgi:hypothetical protein